MKGFIEKNILRIRLCKAVYVYRKESIGYMKRLGIKNTKVEGEDEYVNKWKQLFPLVDRPSYRLYSHYCGQTPDIVPEGISRILIEKVLDPIPYRYAYEDKNMFPLIIGKEYLPETVVARINGSVLLDSNYRPLTHFEEKLQKYDRLILKPTVSSSSGRGVLLFQKKEDGVFVSNKNEELTIDYLLAYGNNFVLQKALIQHPDLSRFNPDSINTIRIATYRSVKDEKVHLLSSIIRIGKNGQFVDNAHAGGRFVGVNVENGKLGSYTCDQYGERVNTWNDVDFSNNEFYIPSWDKIVSFAQMIGEKVTHHRLLAMDISVDENGRPWLVEYNLEGFSQWLFEFTGQKPFGNYTDEIIAYCKDQLSI